MGSSTLWGRTGAASARGRTWYAATRLPHAVFLYQFDTERARQPPLAAAMGLRADARRGMHTFDQILAMADCGLVKVLAPADRPAPWRRHRSPAWRCPIVSLPGPSRPSGRRSP